MPRTRTAAQLAVLTARLRSGIRAWATVADIIESLRQQGDSAVLQLTQQHDHHPATSMDELVFGQEDMQRALDGLDATTRGALEVAAARIRDYHERQMAGSWSFEDALGNQLGQQVTPMERVGIYVPGGKASYPSSVLMNAIPARVAGVEVVMTVPGRMAPGATASWPVTQVIAIGGAGRCRPGCTSSVPRVDKIVARGIALSQKPNGRYDVWCRHGGTSNSMLPAVHRLPGGHGPVFTGRAR